MLRAAEIAKLITTSLKTISSSIWISFSLMVSRRSAVISTSGGIVWGGGGQSLILSHNFHHLISDHAFWNKINFLGYLINQIQVIAVGANPGRHNEIALLRSDRMNWCPCWSRATSCRLGCCESAWDLPLQPFLHHHAPSGSHSHKGVTLPFIRNNVKTALTIFWLILGAILHHPTAYSLAHVLCDHPYQSYRFKNYKCTTLHASRCAKLGL